MTLGNEDEVARYAARLRAYAGVTHARWVIAAPTFAEASRRLADVGARLMPSERALLTRVRAEMLPPATTPPDAPAVGWVEASIGEETGGQTCSWQVWVTDPELPSREGNAGTVPLASGDKIPVGAAATFRVGYTGLLQSKLYAFGETTPGHIRDLSTIVDINIPVAKGEGTEKLLLVRARQSVPFLERIHASLADSTGTRRVLGKEYALQDTVLGQRRGVGANIQVVQPDMIVRDLTGSNLEQTVTKSTSADLLETCTFSLVSLQETQ